MTLADGEQVHGDAVDRDTPAPRTARASTSSCRTASARRSRPARSSKGVKPWIRLRGEYEPFVALGGADWPITFLQTEYWDGGDTLVVGFGPDAAAIDVTDLAAVQEQVRRLVPDAEVVDVASHDWVADPLRRRDLAHAARRAR